MRVMIFTELYLPDTGGSVVHVEQLTRVMAQEGHEVTVIAPAYEDAEKESYPVIADKRRFLFVPVGTEIGHASFKGPRRHLITKCRKWVHNWVEKYKPQIIHAMYGHYIHEAFRDIPVKKIWTCHSVPPQEYAMPVSNKSLRGRIINKTYAYCVGIKHKHLIRKSGYDDIIAVSEATKCLLAGKTGMAPSKITVIPNGTNWPERSPRISRTFAEKGIYRLLTVGRVSRHKCIDHVPLIAKSLQDGGCLIEWHLVGQHEDMSYVSGIQKSAKKLGVHHALVWHGLVSEGELHRQYGATDFYVHLSRQEGFCMAVLDALAAGVPVIGTNVGAIAEMVQQGGGIIVDPSWASVASGIKWAINNNSSLSRGESLTEKIGPRYRWKAVAQMTTRLYERTLSFG